MATSQRGDRFRVHAVVMADNDDSPDVPETPAGGGQQAAETSAQPEPVLPPDTAPPAQPVLVPRLRDRVWSFRAVLAVALATFLVGGLAGGAIVGLTRDDHPDRRGFVIMHGRDGAMPPGWRMPHRFRDGSPQWRWNDGQPPGPGTAPNGTPTNPTPSPTPKP